MGGGHAYTPCTLGFFIVLLRGREEKHAAVNNQIQTDQTHSHFMVTEKSVKWILHILVWIGTNTSTSAAPPPPPRLTAALVAATWCLAGVGAARELSYTYPADNFVEEYSHRDASLCTISGTQCHIGETVAVSGDGNTAVAGAPNRDAQSGNYAGRDGYIHIFERGSSGIWSLTKTMAGDEERLGMSVALNGAGDVLAVVGEMWPYDSGNNKNTPPTGYVTGQPLRHGRVHIIKKDSSTGWPTDIFDQSITQIFPLPDNATAMEAFGKHVSLTTDGKRVAFGVAGDGSTASPTIWMIYDEDTSGNWNQACVSLPDSGLGSIGHNGMAGDLLARHYPDVEINGDGTRLVVGVSNTGVHDGLAQVWELPAIGTACGSSHPIQKGSTITAHLRYSGNNHDMRLGHSVAISSDGDRILVGASGKDAGYAGLYIFDDAAGDWAEEESGTVYGYTRAMSNHATGSEYDRLTDLDVDMAGEPGCALGMSASSGILVVGSNCDGDTSNQRGGTLVLGRDTSSAGDESWSPLNAIHYDNNDRIGASVAINPGGTVIVLGAPGFAGGDGGLRIFHRSVPSPPPSPPPPSPPPPSPPPPGPSAGNLKARELPCFGCWCGAPQPLVRGEHSAAMPAPTAREYLRSVHCALWAK